jgi:hypothetical protein
MSREPERAIDLEDSVAATQPEDRYGNHKKRLSADGEPLYHSWAIHASLWAASRIIAAIGRPFGHLRSAAEKSAVARLVRNDSGICAK